MNFDRMPFLKHSTAAPWQTPPANNLRTHLNEVIKNINSLDNQQLAALYTAVEVEHCNRQAELAGCI